MIVLGVLRDKLGDANNSPQITFFYCSIVNDRKNYYEYFFHAFIENCVVEMELFVLHYLN